MRAETTCKNGESERGSFVNVQPTVISMVTEHGELLMMAVFI
jgi:hypothetical protein